MSEQDPAPELHIDADWKAEAQAEKERLAAKEAEQAAEDPGSNQSQGPGELPEADFKALMGLLASQAIMGLGAYTDPKTGGVIIDLAGSKFAIDLLAVLEEKTAGNVSEEEAKELTQVLVELRSRFVQVADAVAKQQEANPGSVSAQPSDPSGGVIETP